ncbi:FAD-dependent oxidoreductase [Candidatus Neomarinimicrobiota bacterium]
MDSQSYYDVIIIGGGIGGCAAALRAGQNNMRTLLLTGSKVSAKRSRSQWVMNIDNMIGMHEGVIKDQVINTLSKAGNQEATDLIRDTHYHINNRGIIKNTIERLASDFSGVVTVVSQECSQVERMEDGFTALAGEESYSAPAMVLATGIMDRQPQLKVVDREGVVSTSPKPIFPFANRESLLYCIRCEGHLTIEDSVAVIGHSTTAVELAMILHERYGNQIYLLTHGESPILSTDTKAIFEAYNIEVIDERIDEFSGAKVGQLCCVKFQSHPEIYVKFGLVSLGTYRVYNDLARQVGAQLTKTNEPPEQRQILVNNKSESSVRNFFVVGDAGVRFDEPVMKQIYTAQEYAVRAIDTIDHRKRRRMRAKVLNQND